MHTFCNPGGGRYVKMHTFCNPGGRRYVKMHTFCNPDGRRYVKMHTFCNPVTEITVKMHTFCNPGGGRYVKMHTFLSPGDQTMLNSDKKAPVHFEVATPLQPNVVFCHFLQFVTVFTTFFNGPKATCRQVTKQR
jgi:hypothetical protein